MESEKKVNIFSRPEEIDAYMINKISQFSVKNGKSRNDVVKWREEELDLRDAVIMDYITVNMLSREKTAQQIASRWNLGMSTARKYVNEALKRFCESQTAESEEIIRKRFEEQVNTVMNEAMEAGDRMSTLKALDMIAKSAGMYREKADVNVNLDGSVTFDFGNKE